MSAPLTPFSSSSPSSPSRPATVLTRPGTVGATQRWTRPVTAAGNTAIELCDDTMSRLDALINDRLQEVNALLLAQQGDEAALSPVWSADSPWAGTHDADGAAKPQTPAAAEAATSLSPLSLVSPTNRRSSLTFDSPAAAAAKGASPASALVGSPAQRFGSPAPRLGSPGFGMGSPTGSNSGVGGGGYSSQKTPPPPPVLWMPSIGSPSASAMDAATKPLSSLQALIADVKTPPHGGWSQFSAESPLKRASAAPTDDAGRSGGKGHARAKSMVSGPRDECEIDEKRELLDAAVAEWDGMAPSFDKWCHRVELAQQEWNFREPELVAYLCQSKIAASMRAQYVHLATETTLAVFKNKLVSLVDRVRASLRRLEIAKRAPRAGDKLAAFATRLYQTFVDAHPEAAAAENGAHGEASGVGLDHKLTRNLHDAVHRIRATLEAKTAARGSGSGALEVKVHLHTTLAAFDLVTMNTLGGGGGFSAPAGSGGGLGGGDKRGSIVGGSSLVASLGKRGSIVGVNTVPAASVASLVADASAADAVEATHTSPVFLVESRGTETVAQFKRRLAALRMEFVEYRQRLVLLDVRQKSSSSSSSSSADENTEDDEVAAPAVKPVLVPAVVPIALDDDARTLASYGVCDGARLGLELRLELSEFSEDDLNDVDVGVRGSDVKAIAAIVSARHGTLSLINRDVDAAGAGALAKALQRNTTVTALECGYNDAMGVHGGTALAPLLRAAADGGCVNLVRLDLDRCALGSAGCAALAVALATNTTLTHLGLARNRIDTDGAQALATHVLGGAGTSGVQVLDLSGNRLGDGGAAALCAALKTCMTLLELSISHNQLGGAGCASLADALDANTKLRRLDASGQSDAFGNDEKSVAALAAALQRNTALSVCVLDDNKLGDVGAHALASALQVNAALLDLSLVACCVGSGGVAALAQALKFNRTLTKLDLDRNDFGDQGMVPLAAALQQNATIQYISLRCLNTEIGESSVVAMAEAVKRNSSLVDVNVDGNHMADKPPPATTASSVAGKSGDKPGLERRKTKK